MIAFVLAVDLIASVMRARRQAIAEAVHGVRQAERYLAWAQRYGGPEQVAAAQQAADAWCDYRDSLR